MDFDLSEDQREIRAVARDLLAARSTWTRVRAAADAGEYDAALWSEICELGWPGIAVREASGGQGLGVVELAVLLEELGYACAAVPFLSTAVAAAVIDRFGRDSERERFLPGLLDGSLRAGVGPAQLVVDGDTAQFAVVLGRHGPVFLSEFDAEPRETIDPTRRFAAVGHASSGPNATDAAALVAIAVAAELVGVCQRALEMSVAYVKERHQFGVAVGSFQAVSHRCAEMLLATESARSAAYYAAWAADADPARLHEAAAVAAAAAATAGREVAGSAIQVHGGIGFTWEADVHWLYKRAEVDRALLGGAGAHRATLARAVAARVTGTA